MGVKLNLIAAACENLGIGKSGEMPWKLDKEYTYYKGITARTNDKTKKNVLIMGRLTFKSFPDVVAPDKICIILSRSGMDVSKYENVHVMSSFEEAINALENSATFINKFENVWVIGGTSVYKQGLDSDRFYRLYLTRIFKSYECDTFFPELPPNLKKVSDPDIPKGPQEENGIQYTVNVYQK